MIGDWEFTLRRNSEPLDYNSDGGHSGRTLGLHNPSESFVCDGDDAVDDDELHVWFNIADWEFLSNVNDCPTAPTTTIPNVLTMAISIVPTTTISNDDIVAEPNIHVTIEEDGDWMHMDDVQPPASHIHPCPMMSTLQCCQHQINNH